jgi:hypothetical protein
MGYQGREFKLRFEDSPGLEVHVRSLSVGRALKIMQLAERMSTEPTEEDVSEVLGAFVKRVRSWTLADDDDQPLPVTLEALMDWDFGEAMRLAMTWVQQATSVAAPLATGSGAPKPVAALELTIPMTETDSASGM